MGKGEDNRNIAQNIKKQKFILHFYGQYGPTDAQTVNIIEFFSGLYEICEHQVYTVTLII